MNYSEGISPADRALVGQLEVHANGLVCTHCDRVDCITESELYKLVCKNNSPKWLWIKQ